MRVEETASPASSSSGKAITSTPLGRASSAISRASPAARWPKRKLAPTTMTRAETASTSTLTANSSAAMRDCFTVNGSTSTKSMPHSPSSPTRWLRVDSSLGWLPGRVTVMGWRSKVIAPGSRPLAAASSATRASSAWCPRWTPSARDRPAPGRARGRSALERSSQHDPCAGASGAVLDDGDQAAVGTHGGHRVAHPGRAQGLPGRQRRGLALAERADRHRPHRRRRVDQRAGDARQRLQLGERARLPLPERADSRAAQAGQVRQAAELPAEVGGQHPHIGATGARHRDRRQRRRAGPEAAQLQGVNDDRAWSALDRLAAARLEVQALAVQLDRRDHRRDLLLRAEEPLEAARDRRLVDAVDRRGAGRDAAGIERVGLGAEGDPGQVALGLHRQERQQPGGTAERDHQHAGGRRVERAAMPDAPLVRKAPDLGDHVVGGRPGRLVADEHAIHARFAHLLEAAALGAALAEPPSPVAPASPAAARPSPVALASPVAARWATRASTIASMVPAASRSEVKPAASAWPPPPKRPATSATLVAPLERSETLMPPSGCSFRTAATSLAPSVRTRSMSPSVASMPIP